MTKIVLYGTGLGLCFCSLLNINCIDCPVSLREFCRKKTIDIELTLSILSSYRVVSVLGVFSKIMFLNVFIGLFHFC